MHTLCAFANDFNNLGGGYILLGIAEHEGRPILPPVGLPPESLDRIQKELLNIGHRIAPNYHPVAEPCIFQGANVLVIRAPGGQHRPYRAPVSLAKDGDAAARMLTAYLRRHSNTVKASESELRELYQLAAQIPFDDRINQRYGLQDLHLSLIQAYLRDVRSDLCETVTQTDFRDLCEKMNIISGPAEETFPVNVGLMFFHPRPDAIFPQTQIDVVQFPDGPGGNTIIEKSFRGPLGQMLRDALYHISNTLINLVIVKHPDRAEADRFYNYPYEAVEEILVNAVYHRDYEIREPIEVRILQDHITITSYPGPDKSIALEKMRTGRGVARRYRNRRIGDFLKELNLTEGRGTGIPKVIRVMQRNGSPEPEFETDEERTYFTATLPIHPGAYLGGTTQVTPQVTPQVTAQTSLFGAERTAEKITVESKVNLLLDFCRSPRDRASIQARLKLRDTKHFRRTYLNPLIEQGLLAMTDPEHPNSPMQKYWTTERGEKSLAPLVS